MFFQIPYVSEYWLDNLDGWMQLFLGWDNEIIKYLSDSSRIQHLKQTFYQRKSSGYKKGQTVLSQAIQYYRYAFKYTLWTKPFWKSNPSNTKTPTLFLTGERDRGRKMFFILKFRNNEWQYQKG